MPHIDHAQYVTPWHMPITRGGDIVGVPEWVEEDVSDDILLDIARRFAARRDIPLSSVLIRSHTIDNQPHDHAFAEEERVHAQ